MNESSNTPEIWNDINLARMTPAGFAFYASGGQWKLAKHLALLNRKLVDLASGRITRLIVNMPPRHGKSELISKYFPAWYLGTFPDNKIIFSTYEASFAAQFGAAAREIFEENGEKVFGLKVDEKSFAASHWKINKHQGSMTTAGVGGPITGKGANCLIIDDPIKNDEEANSLIMQEKLWAWFGKVAYTRLQPGGNSGICLIMTRWATGDLAGRLLEAEKSGGDKWEKVIFPAIAEEDEPQLPQGMGRKKGEALWPEYWDLEKLNRIKNSGALSSYGWSALYQQSPAPEGGGIFKDEWFKYFFIQNDYYVLQGNEKKGDFSTQFIPFYKCWKLITVDTANKVNNTSDYTGIAVWAITPNRDLLLLETHYGRIPYDQIIPILKELNRMHKPQYIGIENTGVAIQLIIEARNKGLAVRALEPEGKGKQNRANTPLGAVVRMEAGKIYFNKSDANFDELKRQLLYFPKHTSDEFVDLLAYAANELTKSDMYDSQDFSPYAISDNLPVGIKKGNNTSSYFF